MQHAAIQTITSSVNESRLIENLKVMFSTSTVVLSELMQNARRAGAASVHFDYDEGSNTLIVTDTGCGIADWQTLLTVAESGWDSDVVAAEQPYGMGFFSVAFAAESISVESRGKCIRFTADALIAKQHIAVEPSDFIGGTRISLHAPKLRTHEIATALAKYALGFAIPLFWQGQVQTSTHAQAAIPGVMTDVGFVSVACIHRDQRTWSHGVAVFCQGLPVRVDGLSSTNLSWYSSEAATIVHLDHQRFAVRMPDREAVVDGEKVAQAISAVLKSLLREFLEREKGRMDPLEFAEAYWDIAKASNLWDVMNDVPVLPRQALWQFERLPYRTADGESYMMAPISALTREQITSGNVVLFRDYDVDDEEGLGLLKLMCACKLNWMNADRLPAAHWAVPFTQVLDDIPVTYEATGNVVTDTFSGHYVYGTVRMVDSLQVTFGEHAMELEHAVAIGLEDEEGLELVVPRKGLSSASSVLRQASTYTDNNECYAKVECDIDERDFDNLVLSMAGEEAAETLQRQIRLSQAREMLNLRGKQFQVSIDAKGDATVILM